MIPSGIKARGQNVVEILRLVSRKEMKDTYVLSLSEIYAITDYIDELENEIEVLSANQ